MALIDSPHTTDHLLTARHPAMTLLSGPLCVFSHCCRIVLLEKDIEPTIEYVSERDDPMRLGEHNPYGETPTLIDRDLTLYDITVITEYLDERFPHPPLLPVDPIGRAKVRLMISRVTRVWLMPVSELGETAKPELPAELKKSLRDGLLALSPLFTRSRFFHENDYTLADAYLTPLLWRLPMLGVTLPKAGNPLLAYGERMFKRSAFIGSLSPREADLR